ncbi:hypothetical protein ONS95_000739 [Cadophora gregata]|uniref:uncharacterized protein n=1 Tax=Cadophora gregata TaxID=51156 RepID=UPI0026DB76F0|nr:uncharacterized protein ONS95_000739 [Cadophora gregata]KAK0103082.1 hypothetical protein ONS96_005693 [Cadophora gregata f. sp. sojae]KAK0128789.1 hypothetical protein ONS95_000739 [Cadophora gregata]
MASDPIPNQIKPLLRSLYPATITYTPQDLRRQDEGSDVEWYQQPRFVQHIDDGAIVSLKSYYDTIIKPSHSILDLCSSWTSHLSRDLKPQSMIGYGMNKVELERNSHLTKYFVKDLNKNPSLEEVPSESVDTVICNVSVDYLTQPVSIFKEMYRVLKVGGTAHMAFSNRCFATKVIGKWMRMDDEGRRQWVGGYFWASSGWQDVEEVILKEGKAGKWGSTEDPLFVVRARKAAAS